MEIKYILLFGMPRSGTTWLGKTFDSHPDTLYRHEPDSLYTLDFMPLLAPVGEVERYREKLRDYIQEIGHIRSPRITSKLPLFPKSYHSSLDFHWRRLWVLTGKVSARFGKALPVPNRIDFAGPGKVHLVWKSIESLGRLGVVANALDDCRAVQIIRHPCGYVASVLRGEAQGKLGGGVAASEDYGIFELLLETRQARNYGLDMGLIRRLHPVERLAWRWVLFNEKALDDTDRLKNCTYVRYEDICEDPLKTYHELFDFTRLSWHPQAIRFVTQSTNADKSDYYSVFRDPKKAADSWQGDLSSEYITRVLDVVTGTRPGALYGLTSNTPTTLSEAAR